MDLEFLNYITDSTPEKYDEDKKTSLRQCSINYFHNQENCGRGINTITSFI